MDEKKKQELLEKIRKIKKLRTDPEIINLSKVQRLTAKRFWTELDLMVDLNFEDPLRKMKAIENRLYFDVILPGCITHPMNMDVYFDEDGSIETINFDPGREVHYELMEMVWRSKLRKNVELGLT